MPNPDPPVVTPADLIPMLADAPSRLSLDGEWRVSRWPFGVAESQLAATETADGDWERVQQPGKVFYADPEAEKEPIPDWSRITLTHIDPDDGAVLRRRVGIPADYAGQRLILRFDAVFPAARFYVNGTLLGEHLSGLTPASYDITDHVTPGADALVAVRLIRRHPMVQMDMVRHALEFAGLAQSAWIFAVAPCYIQEHHLQQAVTPDLSVGRLGGTVSLHNGADDPADGHLTLQLLDADQCVVAEQTQPVAIEPGASAELPAHVELAAPAVWNDEYPQLYHVRLALQIDGQAEQTVAWRCGFRHFQLSPDGPRLNGRPVKFRGVNHLTFHPEHGMHTPRPWLRQNLTLMKKANVNCIRTHFLGPPDLAELCDELGIYLLQELPIDWGTDYIHDPAWIGPARARIAAGVRRDRNHPAVMVWSVGNENMPKTAAVADAGWEHLRGFHQLCKLLDPTRPTMFPPPGPANKIDGILELRVGDIADTHYSFDHIKRFLADGAVENPNSWEADMTRTSRDEALAKGWSGCWFSSEYGIFNAMPDLLESPWCSIIDDEPADPLGGQSTQDVFAARLAREWGYMRHEPSCLGGAYFPWLCAGAGSAEAGNPWGWVRWGEDADWGVVTADLLPKPFFWAMRTLFSPVWFPTRLHWQPGADHVAFTVWNQYNQIDLADCTLRVQLAGAGRYMTMMRKFTDVPIACPPGDQAECRIPVPKNLQNQLANGTFVLLRLTLLDPTGFRPITAEALILPPAADSEIDAAMPIGPDAEL